MTTRHHDIGVVLTSAALLRVRRIAEARGNTPIEIIGYGSEDEMLSALGDHWMRAACTIYMITKDLQATQDVIAAALNKAARGARQENGHG